MSTINSLRGKVEDEILRKLEVLKVDQVMKFNLKYINLDKLVENLSKEAKILCLIISENNLDSVADILRKRGQVSPKTSIMVMVSRMLDTDEMLVAMVKGDHSFSSPS